MKLYSARSVIPEYHGVKNLVMRWYCGSRNYPVLPYNNLIKDYYHEEAEACYSEYYADELFTEKEIEELRNYLSEFHQIELNVTEEAIPIDKNLFPLGAIPSGSMNGSMLLCNGEESNCSIPICGYYDLRSACYDEDCEVVEEEVCTDEQMKERVCNWLFQTDNQKLLLRSMRQDDNHGQIFDSSLERDQKLVIHCTIAPRNEIIHDCGHNYLRPTCYDKDCEIVEEEVRTDKDILQIFSWLKDRDKCKLLVRWLIQVENHELVFHGLSQVDNQELILRCTIEHDGIDDDFLSILSEFD